MKEITVRQHDTLEAIVELWSREGVPPTFREIGEKLGVTAEAAYDSVRWLEKKGALRLCSRVRSNVRLPEESQRRIVTAWATRLGMTVAAPEPHAWASEEEP